MFGNSWGNLHIPCLLLIITFRSNCGERKLAWNIKVSKYHEYVWGIKFQLSLKILIFWENIPKKSIYGQKQKKWTSPLSLHIRISLATKFQLKLTIMIFWTKLAQQDCFQSKTEKNSNTIKFCVFELLSVPGFSINW